MTDRGDRKRVPAQRGRSAPPDVERRLVSLQSSAKKQKVETETKERRDRPHHGLERLPVHELRVEILRGLDAKSVARWMEGAGSARAVETLKAAHLYRVYTNRDAEFFASSEDLYDDLRKVLPKLRGLRFDTIYALPGPRTWLRICQEAEQLQVLEWIEPVPGESAHYIRTHYMRFLPRVLPRLVRLQLEIHGHEGEQDVLHLDHWLLARGANVRHTKLTSLVLATPGQEGAHWPAAVTGDMAAAFPNLQTLDLWMRWNDETLRALVDRLPDLRTLSLRARRSVDDWPTDAKTVDALLRGRNNLRNLCLSKCNTELRVTERSSLAIVAVAQSGRSRDVPPDVVVTVLAVAAAATTAAGWTTVSVATSDPRALGRSLALRATALPPIASLVITPHPYMDADEWDDTDRPWLTDDEVRALLRVVTRIRIDDRLLPDRYVEWAPGATADAPAHLHCNRVAPATLYPWIRAGAPLLMIHIGHASQSITDEPNPADAPEWSDELCRVLLEPQVKAVHASSLRGLFTTRRRPEDPSGRVWDGKLVASLVREYPRLASLSLHGTGHIEPLADVLAAMSERAAFADVDLGTREPLTLEQHWRRLPRISDGLALASSAREGGDRVTNALLRTVLSGPLKALKFLALRLEPTHMQGSTPESDWSAIGEHPHLERIVLGRLPSPGITDVELRQMLGATPRASLSVHVDPDAPYHPRHRWPTPAQQRTWDADVKARVQTLRIVEPDEDEDEQLARPVTWSDEATEAKLVRVDTKTSAPAPAQDKPFASEWKWLATRSGLDVAVAFVHVRDRFYARYGHVDAATRVYVEWRWPAAVHVFIRGPDPRMRAESLVFCESDADIQAFETAHPWLANAISARDILPPSWLAVNYGGSTRQQAHRCALFLVAMRLLNSGVPMAAIAQYTCRPASGDDFEESMPPEFSEWCTRVKNETHAYGLATTPDEQRSTSTIEAFGWPTLFDPPVDAPLSSSSSASAAGATPMQLEPPAASAPRAVAQSHRPVARIAATDDPTARLVRVGEQRDALDARREAERAVAQDAYTFDLAARPDLDASRGAQIRRLDLRRAASGKRQLHLGVARASLVEPLQRVLGPYARAHHLELLVSSS